jgi:hypothetical protein
MPARLTISRASYSKNLIAARKPTRRGPTRSAVGERTQGAAHLGHADAKLAGALGER